MSHAQRKIKQESIQKNVENFLIDLSDLECYQLCMYLGGRFMTEDPDNVQSRFVEDFFDTFEWSKYIAAERLGYENKNFFYRPPFDLESVRITVMYVTLQRIPEMLSAKTKAEIKLGNEKIKESKLKLKLIQAVQESYEDGVFDKCDGWCNISDVLVDAKLLILPDEE